MAAPRTTANAEGSLYELVSRGNKDAYFFQDLPDSKFLFDNAYDPQAKFSYEIRRVPPRTAAEFGRVVEFDFDLVGDIMREPTLLITLPSWLPPTYAALNPTSVVQDLSGLSYGYVNGIAYFLFDTIQFYQDNILLQEFSGDTLWATAKPHGTYGSSFVGTKLAGQHTGSVLDIGRNATPGLLRLPLPLVGCQGGDPGFPQRAVTRHSYRLRCRLRRLEDLVESSDAAATQKPTPWGQTFQIKSTRIGSFTPFQTLTREQIPPLTLQLETTQVYVSRDIQTVLESKPNQWPFRRFFENRFTQGPADYLSVQGGAVSSVTRRLDGRHPTGKILWYFRNLADENANRLWKISNSTGTSSATTAAAPFYTNLSLIIAGQARELPRAPLVWRDVVNFAKEEIDTGEELNTMNWTLGDIAPLRFPGHRDQPTGTIEMSTADRPSFYIDLAPLPAGQTPYTKLYVITEGWAVFQTDGNGRAELMSAN